MLDISNYYEQLVTDQLWQLIEDSHAKDEPISQVFIEDVACLALNNLPVCYVRNKVDKSTSLTEIQHDAMRLRVNQAIAKAIEQVEQRPHHARDE